MKKGKRILGRIAKNYRVDPDVLLIRAWYQSKSEFDYLVSENSVVRKKHLKIVRQLALSEGGVGLKKRQLNRNHNKSVSPVDFSVLGKNMESFHYLSLEDVVAIHNELVADFEGSANPMSPPGLKDPGLLESAIYRQQSSFDGVLKYPTIESAAASLMYGISNNHCFFNGNKRTALVSVLVFLDRYNICVVCDDDSLFKLSVDVASHSITNDHRSGVDGEVYALASWICQNSKTMRKGERPITLRKLKQILTKLGCNYDYQSNGHVFTREVKKTSIFGLSPFSKKLVTRLPVVISEGEEIDKGLLNSVRKDLEFDSEHGTDSDMFYSADNQDIGHFIIRYRKVLKRLSKI